MNVPNGMMVLFQGKADYMREIAAHLTDAGIRCATGPLPGSWDPKIWLAVASADRDKAMAVHQRHLDLMVEREGLPVADHTADFDAEETCCPACMTKFRTAGTTRCPECGLNFA